MRKVCFLTGAEGVGKSSVIPKLKEALSTVDVWDFDNLHRPFDFSEKWYEEVLDNCIKQIVERDQVNRPLVVVGLIYPSSIIANLVKIGLSEYYFGLLDCSLEIRAERLRARNADERLIANIDNLETLRQQMHDLSTPMFILNTSHLNVYEVAELIISRIRKLFGFEE